MSFITQHICNDSVRHAGLNERDLNYIFESTPKTNIVVKDGAALPLLNPALTGRGAAAHCFWVVILWRRVFGVDSCL